MQTRRYTLICLIRRCPFDISEVKVTMCSVLREVMTKMDVYMMQETKLPPFSKMEELHQQS